LNSAKLAALTAVDISSRLTEAASPSQAITPTGDTTSYDALSLRHPGETLEVRASSVGISMPRKPAPPPRGKSVRQMDTHLFLVAAANGEQSISVTSLTMSARL